MSFDGVLDLTAEAFHDKGSPQIFGGSYAPPWYYAEFNGDKHTKTADACDEFGANLQQFSDIPMICGTTAEPSSTGSP